MQFPRMSESKLKKKKNIRITTMYFVLCLSKRWNSLIYIKVILGYHDRIIGRLLNVKVTI